MLRLQRLKELFRMTAKATLSTGAPEPSVFLLPPHRIDHGQVVTFGDSLL
jgi:hypothetical protein